MTPERIAELRSRSWLDHTGHNRMNADYDEMLDEIERLQGMYADACTEIEVHLADNQKLHALIAEGELEQQLNAKWGVGQFNWCTVQTGGNAKPQWAWFCGTPPGQRGKWMYEGMADTLVRALRAMLEVES